MLDFFSNNEGYILFRMSYNIVMTIASFELAKSIPDTSYGLVFGFNMFVGVGLQSALALAVSSSVGFALDINDQYIVYASWYWISGLVFNVACYARPIYRRLCG